MAFLDDIYAKSNPNRSVTVFTADQEELQRVGIEVHDGKTQLWNRSGVVPTGTEALTEAARISDPDAIVWRGDVSLPPQERGVKVLGTPMGSPEFVRSTLAAVSAKHDRLISQIVGMSDLQCAWILLLYCAAARPNYMLRVVHPTLSGVFARHHDASLRQALSQPVAAPPCNIYWDVVSLPFSRGGLGLQSTVLTTDAAFWASWADSLHKIQKRHPPVGGQILQELSHPHVAGFHLAAAQTAREELVRDGFLAPAWESLAEGLRPMSLDPEDQQLGMPCHGWQQLATDAVHAHLVETQIRPRLSAGAGNVEVSGVPFACFPTSALSRFDSSQLRVLLVCRLWLPLPPSSRNCRCGRLLDVLGNHRAACAEAGVLGRRGYALESAAARVCREAGARVGTNILVRDLDLVPQGRQDARRLDVVAEGLPLFHGAQLAIDTTLVSPVRRDGPSRHLCWKRGGVVGVMAPLHPQPKLWESTATWAVWCELVGSRHLGGLV